MIVGLMAGSAAMAVWQFETRLNELGPGAGEFAALSLMLRQSAPLNLPAMAAASIFIVFFITNQSFFVHKKE